MTVSLSVKASTARVLTSALTNADFAVLKRMRLVERPEDKAILVEAMWSIVRDLEQAIRDEHENSTKGEHVLTPEDIADRAAKLERELEAARDYVPGEERPDKPKALN